MRKIAIIGAGNVGSQTAMALINSGQVNLLLLDVVKGLAKGKAMDLEDCASLLRQDCVVEGSEDFSRLKGAEIVVITAGLSRRPGMSRDDLLKKNSQIIKEVSLKIKEFSPEALVIVVTNPVDIMTSLVARITGFSKNKVLGMGISLDAARFANLLHHELNVPVTGIEAVVVGSHGQTMVPAPHQTQISGVRAARLMADGIVRRLVQETVERGASIVAHLGSGSAFFAPAAAIAQIIRAIIKDEKLVLGVCAYLNGEYGIKDLYLGVPARIGRTGVEAIVEMELTPQEREQLRLSAESVRQQISQLALDD